MTPARRPRLIAILSVGPLALAALLGASACQPEGCATLGCPDGQICDKESGECSQLQLSCQEAACPDGQVCDPLTGRCLDRGSFCREPGTADCPEGDCAVCPEGLECDTQTGFCVAGGECRYLDCPRAQLCNPDTRTCQDIACQQGGPPCPTGSICSAEGTCRAGCLVEADCAQGEICALDGAQESVGSCRTTCTGDEECLWGQVCVLQGSGKSGCEPEPPCEADGQCRSGESCRQGVCQRALCTAEGGCLPGEYCVEDTGECLPDACVPDSFEPNDAQATARRIEQIGGYGSLTLCRGEEDWFRFRVGGYDAMGFSLLHALEVDLDLEIHVEGGLLASSGHGRNSETLVVDVQRFDEVFIRVVPVKGRDITYSLQIAPVALSCQEDPLEPNDRPGEAAALDIDGELSLRLCPGNVDFVSVEAEGGPLTVSGRLDPFEGVALELSLGQAPTEEIATDIGGSYLKSFAHVDAGLRLILEAAARRQGDWTLQAQPAGPECVDPSPGNRAPESALVIDLDLSSPIQSRAQALCSDVGAIEEDWFALDAPEGALEIAVGVDHLTPISAWGAPDLRVSLMTGAEAAGWRSATISAGTSGGFTARLSRLDRPLWLRVDAPAGTGEVLERWPAYQHLITVREAVGCVQDRSEGAGNDTLARAAALPLLPLVALLCPGEVDAFALDLVPFEGRSPTLRIEAPEAEIAFALHGQLDGPALLEGRIRPSDGVVTLQNAVALPEGAQTLWIALRALDPTPEAGARYLIEAR